jgi:hypothetical protein
MDSNSRNEYDRKYRMEHRDEYNGYHRRYYAEHGREKRIEHRDEYNEYHRKYYAEHRVNIAEEKKVLFVFGC